MTQRVTMVCTDKGQHTKVTLAKIDVKESELTEVLIRRGRTPLQGNVTGVFDGESVSGIMPDRMLVAAKPTKEPGRPWTWKCPRCNRNRPLTEANLRKWIDHSLARGVSVLDISHLPM